MTDPLPEIPTELRPLIGHAVAGWNHATASVGITLPSRLLRANKVRRGALLYLNHPKKPRTGR